MESSTLFLALLGGILPALLWLWFWLHEDRLHPEPKRLTIFSFIAGMIAVPLVIPLEHWAAASFTGFALIAVWAGLEEILKYLGARVTALRHKCMDEPIDAVIYLLTAALGFAALENTLFLLSPISEGNLLQGYIAGNLRFLGASLLHVVASASIGICIAFAFYRSKMVRRIYAFAGVILATALHTLFNFFILQSNGGNLVPVFISVWVGIIVLMVMLEKIKRIKPPASFKRNPR